MIRIPDDIKNLGFILHQRGSDGNRLEMLDEHGVYLILHMAEKSLQVQFVHNMFLASCDISYPHPRLAMFVKQAREAKKKLEELP